MKSTQSQFNTSTDMESVALRGTTGGGGLCSASAASRPAALGASTPIALDARPTKPEETVSSKKLRSLS